MLASDLRGEKIAHKGKTPKPLAERFWPKVRMGDDDECWEWTGSIQSGGYGSIGVGSMANGTRRVVPAHRAAWELEVGPIPHYYQVCHHCDNRKCVNPNHLYLGTQKDNIRDMMDRGRWVAPWMERHE